MLEHEFAASRAEALQATKRSLTGHGFKLIEDSSATVVRTQPLAIDHMWNAEGNADRATCQRNFGGRERQQEDPVLHYTMSLTATVDSSSSGTRVRLARNIVTDGAHVCEIKTSFADHVFREIELLAGARYR